MMPISKRKNKSLLRQSKETDYTKDQQVMLNKMALGLFQFY